MKPDKMYAFTRIKYYWYTYHTQRCGRQFFTQILPILLFLISNASLVATTSTANPYLLSRRYNDVAFPAAHNAQSYKASCVCNQDLPVAQQLARGIRALKVHVWYDRDAAGKPIACVCHGMTKDFLSKSYLDEVADKVPRIFRSFARDVLRQMEPLNELIREACSTAYGQGEATGKIQFPHCIFDPSRRQFTEFLTDIRVFLHQNPQEIITLILEDHTNSLEKLAVDLTLAGLDRYAHMQDTHRNWPTLGAMIEQDKRLVLFVQSEAPLAYDQYPWLHNIWDFAWDTEWHFDSASDLQYERGDCMPKRGLQAFNNRDQEPRNKLFIVHHFVTEGTGGSKLAAKKVNRRVCLQPRLKKLAERAGHIPNIIQVDFFEYPNNDLFEVVRSLNESYATLKRAEGAKVT
jgi:hypothetical protein